MIGCVVCGSIGEAPLCTACRRSLTPGRRFFTLGGLLVAAGSGHHGAGRVLVHRLKYQAMPVAAEVLGAGMADMVPSSATALVPVPRARGRRWWFGIDPAPWLAEAVSRRTGVPVVGALTPGWWWPRHAGRGDDSRSAPGFRSRAAPDPGWVLVDDVATSGATLDAAAAAFEGVVRLCLVATAPSSMRVVTRPAASTNREVA
jgi:predicted amidophosphoribosyltransferase